MMSLFRRFLLDRSGATAIEYGLIAALIAVTCIGAMRVVGAHLQAKLNAISGNLS